VDGYNTDIVYVFNKSSVFKNHFRSMSDVNVILMGDHLKDIDIIKEVEYSNSIKIGYFNRNHKKEEKLFNEFKNNYDVVITNDGNLVYAKSLLEHIFQEE